jgi:hypothetical protein|tara:strand:- start:187 stop:1668 length:1482 start_codon:yes stop_codon:yes gene_type:complete
MISINNFTVTVVSFPVIAGVNWVNDNPTALLLLVPNQGYQITASDFSPTLPLPNNVASVVFTQNGTNINCTVTYIDPSIMPSQDVLINICSQGFSRPIDSITINGTINANGITGSTTVPVYQELPYSGSGAFDETNQVANVVIAAQTGYFFPVAPSAALTIGDASDYTISYTNILDANGNIIQTNILVNYTYPISNVTGDVITLFADGQEIYNPQIEIVGYSINTIQPLSAGASSRQINIIGVQGAAWDLNVSNAAGVSIFASAGVIDNTGVETFSLSFPASAVNTFYTLVLTGNLSSSFCTTFPYSPCSTGQPSVWTIDQYVEQSIGFGLTSTSGAVTVGPIDVNAYTFGTGPGLVTYTVTATSTSDFIFDLPITTVSWPTDSPSPPASIMQINSSNTVVDNAATPSTLTITVVAQIDFVGTQSFNSIVDLDNFIQETYQPIALNYSATDAVTACCNPTPVNAFIQIGETFANAVAILDSTGNPAADGFYTQ